MKLSLISFLVLILGWFVAFDRQATANDDLPNVVVIFIDDMGYADIGPFGAKNYKTPNLDQMAKEGRCFTDFLVSSAVCSASRAALLTGCYHERVGIRGAFGPGSKQGIHENEMTLAELFKQKDYATAIYGKWHLGHHPKFLPMQHGFDDYFGLPYSNDMWPYHPGVRHLPMEERVKRWPHLPLIEKNKVINNRVTGKDQEKLTAQYTERAVKFIRANKDRPFFVYVPHSMVHVPLYVSDKFRGKSGAGLYGDVVMEVDWSVGQIISTLKELKIDKKTLVIFTSDNGPWLSYGDHAGVTGELREGKGTEFEGGIREPTIMWWPGKIPAGTKCDELASTIDVLPTVAKLIDAKLPEHKIDGKDIRDLMFAKEGAKSPHEVFYCYYGGQLQAVRDRRFKLHFPHGYRTMAGRPGGKDGIPNGYKQGKIGLELFDLKNDRAESKDVSKEFPKELARLMAAGDVARKDLGDRIKKVKGNGLRPVGKIQSGDKLLDVD